MEIKALATKYRIDRSTVHAHVDRLGLPRRRPLLSPEDIVKAAQMYESGKSLAVVGKHFGVNDTTVLRYFRKAGVPTRKRNGA